MSAENQAAPDNGAEVPKCELCGEPMPEGESMFKLHGYSGPCPKPPLNPTLLSSKSRADRFAEKWGSYDIPRIAYSALTVRSLYGDAISEIRDLESRLAAAETRAEAAEKAADEIMGDNNRLQRETVEMRGTYESIQSYGNQKLAAAEKVREAAEVRAKLAEDAYRKCRDFVQGKPEVERWDGNTEKSDADPGL